MRTTSSSYPEYPGALAALLLGAAVVLGTPAASANVVTDWDEKAVAFVPPSPSGTRMVAMVHLAMFDAVNSIDRRYRPHLVELPASPGTSREAAAATAAAAVLAGCVAENAGAIQAALAAYLESIPDGAAKADGVQLGNAVAAKLLDARANDGADAQDGYRPRTAPGRYVPTSLTVASAWPSLKPFALAKGSQFRPPPPVSLTSPEWTAAYNEVKDFGKRASAKRSARQTETARFWMMIGPPAWQPLGRLVVGAKRLDVVDSARFMALYAVALNDALIAVFDAKYHYEFWRPVTAIRNGDIDDNPATARDPSWQPLDNTPMHPEYACAHCIASGAAAAVIESLLGTAEIPEVGLTSPTAPGVTHRFSTLKALTDEVAQARIWAGFHYRFSTEVGRDMGQKIGRYVVAGFLQPVR